MQGRLTSVNSSPTKGEKKLPVSEAVLVAGYGVTGDAHAGGERQISLLAQESIDRGLAAGIELKAGDFGENITTEGIDLLSLQIGSRLLLAGEVIVQVSHIGKICHTPCSIGQRLGECIMPTDGVFAKVVRGGRIAAGDAIEPTSIKTAAVLTASDRCSRGDAEDESGPILIELVNRLGIALVDRAVLPDEEAELAAKMKHWADLRAVDLILTTGGTGFAPRDRTPEATLAVLDSPASGIAEAIRSEGLHHTPRACLSRAVSGLRGRTLIVNLPGSARAVAHASDLLRAVLPHALELIRSEVIGCGGQTEEYPKGWHNS